MGQAKLDALGEVKGEVTDFKCRKKDKIITKQAEESATLKERAGLSGYGDEGDEGNDLWRRPIIGYPWQGALALGMFTTQVLLIVGLVKVS